MKNIRLVTALVLITFLSACTKQDILHPTRIIHKCCHFIMGKKKTNKASTINTSKTMDTTLTQSVKSSSSETPLDETI